MNTDIISVLLFFISFLVNGQTEDLKVTARYISDNKVSVKIENLTNDTVSMSISPDMGSPWSGMMLTLIKGKKDTIDHYFESLYDKYILYIPPHLTYEKKISIRSREKNTNVYLYIYLRYIVRSKPSKRKHFSKEIRLE